MKTFKMLFLIHFHFFYLTMIPIFSSSNEIAKLKTIIFLCSVNGINKLDKKSGFNFESVHGILKCDHSNESYRLSCTLLTNPKM